VCATLRARGVDANFDAARAQDVSGEIYRLELRRRSGSGGVTAKLTHERGGLELAHAQTDLASLDDAACGARALVPKLLGPPARTRRTVHVFVSPAPSATPRAIVPAQAAPASSDGGVTPPVDPEPAPAREECPALAEETWTAPTGVEDAPWVPPPAPEERERLHTGAFVGGGPAYGALTDAAIWGVKAEVFGESEHAAIGFEYQYLGGGGASAHGFNVVGRALIGGRTAFMIGGGGGFATFQTHSIESGGDARHGYATLTVPESGGGLGLLFVLGVEALRTTAYRFRFEARLGLPLFSATGTAVGPSTKAGLSGPVVSGSTYAVPGSLSVSFYF
jgi:hypothetical protein